MENFKKNWQIHHNWQLLFPVLGVLILGYSSYRLADVTVGSINLFLVIILTIVFFFILLKLTLFLFRKLERKWAVEYRWEMIRVFIVFAITGSSSVFVGKPIIAFIGITKDNFNVVFYWILYILVGIIFYQILLVCYGWLFGQFKFFWEFEKKMLKRFGLEKFLNL
jgi:MFS family permease